MNIIDNNFKMLSDIIKNSSLEDIYQNIRNGFNRIAPDIQEGLENYFDKFPYWGKIKRNNGIYEELYYRAKSLKEHIDDYVWLYDKLGDYRSKKLLFAILNNWYQFDFATLNTSIEKNYPHYFDLDLVKCTEKEVFVDLGAYTGDTVIDYLNYYGADNYSKIYCYEITDDSFLILKNNLCYYPSINFVKKAVSNKVGKLYFLKSGVDDSANMVTSSGDIEIDSTTIDEDIKECVSMIKMDIEGSEVKALEGAKSHIINDHPKLLISVYHNHDDLWKIPKMIEEMCSGYKFYLRYYGNNIFPTETVLIAIYENKEDLI